MASDRMMVDDDDQYASSEDSDFAPDTADVAASDASESEGEPDQAAAATTKKQRPVKSKAADAEGDEGYDNSGDEAIIQRGRKRRKRAQGKGVEDDEGGEGGLVKTRRQRAAEYVQQDVIEPDIRS